MQLPKTVENSYNTIISPSWKLPCNASLLNGFPFSVDRPEAMCALCCGVGLFGVSGPQCAFSAFHTTAAVSFHDPWHFEGVLLIFFGNVFVLF